MNIISRCCLLFALALSVNLAFAHGKEKPHDMTPPDSLAVSVAFDQTGRLWRVGVNDGFVEVSQSADSGKTFSSPVQVNPEKQKITAHGEIRPKIAMSKEGQIYVTWMQNLPTRFSGHIWFARSVDGGNTFERPYVLHQDRAEIGHAFEELVVSFDGKITVLWLDSRDLVKAMQVGKKHTGSSIYYAVSTDGGKTFQPEQKLAGNSCECCRIATTTKPDGTVVALWRHVFEGSERDHMMAEIPALGANQDAAPRRATFGHWQIDGCPHHGAALVSGGEGKDWWGYHMAYYDGNEKKPGLYYSRMDGVAWASSPAKQFGNSTNQAGHPALLSLGNKVYLAWREQKDGKSIIMGMVSDDDGKSWGNPQALASSKQKADYPFLLQHQGTPYLVWSLAGDGLQLVNIKDKFAQ